MTIRNVQWCSRLPKLPCANALVQDVILCLQDAALVVQPDPACALPITTINATICQAYSLCDSCTNQVWNYTFAYDDTQLVEPQTPLTSGDIAGVFCLSCETDWIEQQISCGLTAAQCVTDTETLDLVINSETHCISGNVNVSIDDGNAISIHPDGLYATGSADPFITAIADTQTIDLDVSAETLSAAVLISSDGGNQLSAHADGL